MPRTFGNNDFENDLLRAACRFAKDIPGRTIALAGERSASGYCGGAE